MKKIIMLLLVVLIGVSLVGCTPDGIIDKQKETTQTELNGETDVPFEFFDCVTYVDGDTYNYDGVKKYSTYFLTYDEFCNKYNLQKNNDFYVIDNYSKLINVYCNLTGCVIDPLPYEEGNKPFSTNVQILIRRTARSSAYIKATYQDNTNTNMLEVSYPYENELGAEALFYCFDLVTIPRSNFNRLYPEYHINPNPFEMISDDELEYIFKNASKYPTDMGIINGKVYGRVINSSTTKENAIEVATEYFTDVRYQFSTNIVVDTYIDIETELFYGIYVKWEHDSAGKKSYYDEYVISFKKNICDYTPKRLHIGSELKIIFKTNDLNIIKYVMDYLYYNDTYNIEGFILLNSIIEENDNEYKYTFYEIETCYGDWGLQDQVSLVKNVFIINKESGEVSTTSEVIKTIYIDGGGIYYDQEQ